MSIQIAYRPQKRSNGILGGLLGTAANALTGGLLSGVVGNILGNAAGNAAGNVVGTITSGNNNNGGYATTVGSNTPQQISYNNPVYNANIAQQPATPQGSGIMTSLQQQQKNPLGIYGIGN